MFNRILQIEKELEGSVFFFGARQTGKSTVLRQQFPDTLYVDLLDSNLKSRFTRRPYLLYEMLYDKAEGTLVIIDEIPEVPELLNEVHRLISERHHVFILCGSSARKLKRRGKNTLGGRALPVYFYPFVSAEIPDFDLEKAITYGMIPSHYLAKNPARQLEAYIQVYLKEEIKEEALVRNLNSFQRFLEVAALTDGEMVNYNNIASDCGVSATTVSSYFDILEDTLVGYRIPAFRRVIKRKLIQTPRFYYFDVGVVNHLLHRKELVRGTPEYGHAFEHLVIQELYAWMHYSHSEENLSYWRTYTGLEVDVVIGDARVAIEIKSVEEVMSKHLKGLKAFGEEHPSSRKMIVSLDPINRRIGDIECVYVLDFFKNLWKEGL
ncbi:MAG: ATP-binding protein [Bacteroidales bacterium]|nr:ATP-binding protein [Bacteroidales bacterium]